MFRVSAISLLVLLLPSPARSTSVEAVTFEEMVQRAERIFVGEVVDVSSFRADTTSGLRIRTRVTFRTSETVLGAGPLVVLEFRGGTVGGRTEQVEGMPSFAVGDEYVVFAHDGAQWVSPIVGLSQGLFHVSRDARDGASLVLTHDGVPVATTTSVGRPRVRVAPTMSVPMTLSAFMDAVHTELVRNPHK